MKYEQKSPADHVQLGFFLKLRVSFCLFYNTWDQYCFSEPTTLPAWSAVNYLIVTKPFYKKCYLKISAALPRKAMETHLFFVFHMETNVLFSYHLKLE